MQWIMIKDPGPGGMRLRHVPLDMSFAEAFDVRNPDAYERLLLDVLLGELVVADALVHGPIRDALARVLQEAGDLAHLRLSQPSPEWEARRASSASLRSLGKSLTNLGA